MVLHTRSGEAQRVRRAPPTEQKLESRRTRFARCNLNALRKGYTLIEIMIVMAIISILVSIAVPIYQKALIRSKEAVLKNNLFSLRTVIDEYTYDKQKAPQSLQELVSSGYLRDVPLDPMTGSNQWRTIMEDATQSVNQSEPGIFDVRSMSEKSGLDGTPYSEW